MKAILSCFDGIADLSPEDIDLKTLRFLCATFYKTTRKIDIIYKDIGNAVDFVADYDERDVSFRIVKYKIRR